MPLPPSTAPEGETLAAMTARADPDTRRIVEAGQKVLAMLAAISQLSKEALQVRHAAESCQILRHSTRVSALVVRIMPGVVVGNGSYQSSQHKGWLMLQWAATDHIHSPRHIV